MVFGFLNDLIRQGARACFAHVPAEALHHRTCFFLSARVKPSRGRERQVGWKRGSRDGQPGDFEEAATGQGRSGLFRAVTLILFHDSLFPSFPTKVAEQLSRRVAPTIERLCDAPRGDLKIALFCRRAEFRLDSALGCLNRLGLRLSQKCCRQSTTRRKRKPQTGNRAVSR